MREIRELANEHSPTVLCLQKTQLPKIRVEGLARSLGFDFAFAVNSSGRSGGLAIFWNKDINIEILPYSQYHIDAIVSSPTVEPWCLTCVYGEAQVSVTRLGTC